MTTALFALVVFQIGSLCFLPYLDHNPLTIYASHIAEITDI
jgi:hypothetical protein